ncbi:MAG: ABC transporter substrate-binding protein [Opitutales bacterium]
MPKQQPSMRQRFFVFLAVITGGAGLALLAACQPPPEVERGRHPAPDGKEVSDAHPGDYGGVFVLSLSTEPKSFNFLVPSDAATSQVTGQLFNGLTEYDPFEQKPKPSLAESWDIGEDKKTYRFNLRKVNWSDGEPVTADDVIFTFDAIFAKKEEPNPETGKRDYRYPSRYIDQYTMEGEPIRYRKIDRHTVEFETPRTYSPFLNDVGFVPILPEHKLRDAYEDGTLMRRWSTQTAIEEPRGIVGTGPFRIRSYRPSQRLVLEPNPHYWRYDKEGKRLPYLDNLIYKFVKDSNAETILFVSGQTDAASIGVTDIGWVEPVAVERGFRIHNRGPSTGISFFWFNQHPGTDPDGEPHVEPYKLAWFQEPDFRRAILHGFDREGIVEGVYFGRAQVLHSIISPGNNKWHNPDLPRYDYDPEKARRMLRDLGFEYRDDLLFGPEGNRVAWELLLYNASQQVTLMATTLKENMAALGIEVDLKLVDFGTVQKRIGDTFNYEMSVIGWTGGGDPSGGKALYSSSGLYHVWYPEQPEPATEWEAEVDRLLAASERTFDEKERVELYAEIQEMFSEHLPLLYTVTPNSYSGIKVKWRNIQVPPTGSILWNLDEIWTEEMPP